MVRKHWSKPKIMIIKGSIVNSGTALSTAPEYIQYTLNNTATNGGADCVTYDGVTSIVDEYYGFTSPVYEGGEINISMPCS